jgi:hypothetical protein
MSTETFYQKFVNGSPSGIRRSPQEQKMALSDMAIYPISLAYKPPREPLEARCIVFSEKVLNFILHETHNGTKLR